MVVLNIKFNYLYIYTKFFVSKSIVVIDLFALCIFKNYYGS